MKCVVLDYERGEVDIFNLSDTATEEEIDERLQQEYGEIQKTIEYMIIRNKELKVNIL